MKIWKVQASWFPASSVASHITDDKPAPKVLPEGGIQVVSTAVSKVSVAEGVSPGQLTVVFAVVMFAGHVISGSAWSENSKNINISSFPFLCAENLYKLKTDPMEVLNGVYLMHTKDILNVVRPNWRDMLC